MKKIAILSLLVLWPWATFAQAQVPGTGDPSVRLSSLEKEIAAKTADLEEMKRQRNALREIANPAAKTGKPSANKPSNNESTRGFSFYQQKLLRENSNYKPDTVVKTKPPSLDPCDPQRFFIRADSLDNYLYGITPAGKALGASVSYTNDQVAKTQNVSVTGMVSYVVLRDICPDAPAGDGPFVSGYSVAPFVQGKGSVTIPRSKKEQSTTKTGVEAQVEISQGFPLRQVITFSPYYLSDYRGEARAQGVNAYWDFYDARLHLGGYVGTNPILDWYVQLRGEADVRDVSAVGVTNLDRVNYAWVGGTARASFFLFPSSMDVDPLLQNRLSFTGEASWFNDTRSGRQIQKYVATAKYNISESGNSSVQLEYTNGTDKDTLVFLNQVLVKLTYAY